MAWLSVLPGAAAWADDAGDAPETYGDARHGLDPDMRLGALIDGDSLPRHSADARGDDLFGTDDEDGVSGLNFTLGHTTIVRATVTGRGGLLQGWIDWNGDGAFAAPDEQVAGNLEDNGPSDLDPAPGLISFAVEPPQDATTKPSFARFRWSTEQSLKPEGLAGNGEVEDYQIQVVERSDLFPAEGEASCTGANLLNNGSFEEPFINQGPSIHFPVSVPEWRVLSQPFFEFWLSGFEKVPAHTGRQYIEMNVDDPGVFETEAALQPNAEFTVFWAHRGRVGEDTASLEVTLDKSTSFGPVSFTTGMSHWAVRSMTGVTNTTPQTARLTFRSEATFNDHRSIGNLLDSVELCQTHLQLETAFVSRTDADMNGIDSAGDLLLFEYRITNPAGSHKSLTGVYLNDDRTGQVVFGEPSSGDADGDMALDPGETWLVHVNATMTQADIEAGTFESAATATGSTDLNTLTSLPAQAVAPLTQVPRLDITKTFEFISDRGTPGAADTDDVIRYTYLVRNTGNLAIRNVMVNDINNHNGAFPPNPGNATLKDNLPLGDSTGTAGGSSWELLSPGDDLTFTQDYTVVQADVDSGGTIACVGTCQ